MKISVYISYYMLIMHIYLYVYVQRDFYVTRWSCRVTVALLEQELLTIPEHMSSFLVFSGVAQS